jgi:arylsulfatase A-like enzyme
VPLLPTEEFQGKSGLGPYGDFVLMLDTMVGQVMDKLDEKGLTDDTIFIFASDNGCSSMVNYPALISKGHNPSYIFRGTKGDIYDGGHRIPYIIRYPRRINPSSCNQMVSLCDIMATIAELLEIELPENAAEDSISNLPIWQGVDEPVRDEVVLHCLMGNLAIQKGPWRLEFLPGSGGPAELFHEVDFSNVPKFQLYNMVGDIGEQTNLVDKHPEIVAELTELMKKRIEEGRSTPGRRQRNTGPEMWEEISNIYN